MDPFTHLNELMLTPKQMWKMIVGQAIFQLVVTFTLYFAGTDILGYDHSVQKRLELDTVIFNTFVWMQIFNEFNNRRLDNKFNILEGVHRNHFFIAINCLMVGLQVAIIFVGSRAFSINPGGLDGTQWAISVVLAAMCLPWAVAVRLFPDAWFAKVACIVGKPVLVVYRALAEFFSSLMRPLKNLRKKKKSVGDVNTADGAPVIVVSGAPRVEVTDLEKGRAS
jgi:Ca2+-transporting ATPase